MSFADVLRQRLEGITAVSDALARALEEHYRLLLLWNRRLNLTTITELEPAVERHYAESLFLATQIRGGSIYDIGSGAGFPGFPVAAFDSTTFVTLVESDHRKAAFLRETSDLLPNLRVACQRSSRLSNPVDWVIARAVRLDDILEPALLLAARISLLVGTAEKEQLLANPRLAATAAVALPWGNARWLVTARVSRGT